jgi:hypothetical protein
MRPTSAQLATLLPYAPGAVAVLRCLAENPERMVEKTDRLAALSGATAACVSAVKSALCGWIDMMPDRAGGWSRESLSQLAHRLEGFAEGYDLRKAREPEILAIFTLPAGSRLEAALVGGANAHIGYETRDGFRHLAHKAENSLTILTPFLDEKGAEYLIGLARQTKASQKTVVLRPSNRFGDRPWRRYAPAMRSAGLTILEYWLEPDASFELGPMAAETFHAKIAVADGDLVYLGSSNLQSSSLDFGLECGAILTGRAAAQFVRVVEAVAQLATAVS